ncbi:MAG: DUF58 domain-containing protein [Clostridiales bacterium]|jgi:uncharacterized protein (DUF58 family)|nr:DUF58 domain-containing protein [Clostridiales bacterium]
MNLVMALLGAVLLYKLQEYLYRKLWNKGLNVDLSFSKDAAIEGEELSLIETISNRKLLPLPVLQVKFMTSRTFNFRDMDNSVVSDNFYRSEMTSVMMYQTLTKALTFECTKRGYYTIERMEIICSDLFMTKEHVDTFDINIHLYVYPKPIETTRLEATFSKMLGSVISKRYIIEDPFEFRNVREYQSYDGMKSINWKASAKTDMLKVNVFDYTSSQNVIILINTESETIWKYDDLNEESIRIAASLSREFIRQGIPVSIYTNAKDLITKEAIEVPAGSGSNHFQSIQESLARIDLGLEPKPFLPIMHKCLMDTTVNSHVIILSHYQKEDLQQLMLAQRRVKREFSWIVPINQHVRVSVSEELSGHIIEWNIVL